MASNGFFQLMNSTPRKHTPWKVMSLEFKMVVVIHMGFMALFVLGDFLKPSSIVWSFLVAWVLATGVSVRRRKIAGWVWPGVSNNDVLSALVTTILGGIFAFATSAFMPPESHMKYVWRLGIANLIGFGVLTSLKLVTQTEDGFKAQCGGPPIKVEAQPVQPPEVMWKRVTRGVFTVMFMTVWFGFMAFFYFGQKYFSEGLPVPTPPKMVAMKEHGRTRYITEQENHLVEKLKLFGMPGIPIVVALGFLLQFGLKVWPIPDKK